MTSFTDTVKYCFPSPSPVYSTNTDPVIRYDPESEEDQISRGTEKFSIKVMVKSYIVDWLLVVVLWGILFILEHAPGHKREFSLNDISIQHTFAEHERVPPFLLAIFSVGIPLVVLIPISLFVSKTRWDIHNALIGLYGDARASFAEYFRAVWSYWLV
ncbi:hypothetical protein M231_00989 [Tremella mesenterica]|uniref:Uncharacterized protein n=1 Tax=Tremella mesenterica TaxID=5217 RepID=A0A4Q1BUG1_TREME|nr:hypothetical protein M231_00989 [Tremella mesenterica]